MNAFDYYKNPTVTKTIDRFLRYIKNQSDRDDFAQEVYAELYDFMPPTDEDSIRLINKVADKFQRSVKRIDTFESGLDEEGII